MARDGPRPAIPHRFEDITAAWLTNVLQQAAATTARVIDVDRRRDVPQGMKADLTRLVIRYDHPDNDAPRSLVVKLSSRNDEMRMREAEAGYLHEVEFFRDLQHHVTLPTPRCYYSDIDVESGYHVLVLEDLAPAASIPATIGCTTSQAERAVAELARFHAGWWQHARLDRIPWMRERAIFDSAGLLAAHESWWPVFLDKAGHQLTPPVIALGERLGRRRAAIMTALLVTPPRTLIHNDYSGANMMFGPDASFTVIDWQSVRRGRGACDLAWFLGQSLTIENRRAIEADLLRTYHDLLVDGRVADYGFDQLLRDYRLALLQRFGSIISSIVALPFSQTQKALITDVLLPRNVAAIGDHGAGTLLD